jgi:hypothetical protein
VLGSRVFRRNVPVPIHKEMQYIHKIKDDLLYVGTPALTAVRSQIGLSRHSCILIQVVHSQTKRLTLISDMLDSWNFPCRIEQIKYDLLDEGSVG